MGTDGRQPEREEKVGEAPAESGGSTIPPKVIVYSGDGCPACTQVKEFFTRKGVRFEERDVHADESAQLELLDLGFSSIPVVVIGEQAPIPGANFSRLEAALAEAAR